MQDFLFNKFSTYATPRRFTSSKTLSELDND